MIGFLVVFVAGVFASSTVSAANYRVEVEFVRFENPRSLIANGKYCDVFTKCDVMLYGCFDTATPFKAFSTLSCRKSDYELFVNNRDLDKFDINKRLVRNFCYQTARPEFVNVRVEGFDYDYMTKNDLMEQFDCQFAFQPSGRHEMTWSPVRSCFANNFCNGLSLTYRWRIFPINNAECLTLRELSLIPTLATTRTTMTTTTPTTPTTTRTTTTTTTTTTPTTTSTSTSTTSTTPTTTTPTTTTSVTTTAATTEPPMTTSEPEAMAANISVILGTTSNESDTSTSSGVSTKTVDPAWDFLEEETGTYDETDQHEQQEPDEAAPGGSVDYDANTNAVSDEYVAN